VGLEGLGDGSAFRASPDAQRRRAAAAESRGIVVLGVALWAFHDGLPRSDDRILSSPERQVNRNRLRVVCAQIVPKNHQEYQNVSKDIELFRNPGAPESRPISL
jgi:hypothetical protein